MKNASSKAAATLARTVRSASAKASAFVKTTADKTADNAGASCRVEAGLPFVEALARRMAATMPHSIDLSDLVQDGVIGLIDAAHRFDDSRGIKFETFAERRIRGAMIDALRKDAWPRGVRRVRRELEAAREKLRATLGHEPSLADLAHAIGSDEKRLGKTIVRINTIESTSPFSNADSVDESQLPAVLVPAEPERPDLQYERDEVRARVRNAIATLPVREQRVIALYYYNEVTMKDIGAELGVNESRVSQLHARAIRRLRESLGAEITPVAASAALRDAIAALEAKPRMAKASLGALGAEGASGAKGAAKGTKVPMPESDTRVSQAAQKRAGLVLVSKAPAASAAQASNQDNVSRAERSKSPNLKGLESQRQPVSSRKRSASVPATSPVTKITRRASAGVAAAIAR
jgi:RNA polymerase sigma factor for flagellar operon FliA